MTTQNTRPQDFTEDELIAADVWLNANKIKLSDEGNMKQQIHANFLESKNFINRVKREVYE